MDLCGREEKDTVIRYPFLLESSEIGNIGINICNLYSNQLDKHVYFCTGLVAF